MDWIRLLSRLIQAESLPGQEGEAAALLLEALKGMGLTVEESLQFWRSKFKVDSDKFEKQYAYNVRHSYGQEGKRNDYKPWSC